MKARLAQRRGIGNVITTLIILVASVALGAGVMVFGGSMFQTNAKVESIQILNSHAWVSSSGPSVAAFVVQNTGDTPVSIQQISLRGQTVPFSSWYYNNSATVATLENIRTDLRYDATLASIDVGGSPAEEQFTPATGPITLQQRQAAIVYLENPANISTLDVGLDMNLSAHTGKVGITQLVHVMRN